MESDERAMALSSITHEMHEKDVEFRRTRRDLVNAVLIIRLFLINESYICGPARVAVHNARVFLKSYEKNQNTGASAAPRSGGGN